MIYAVIGLVIVLLGVGIGLSVWIARLKGEIGELKVEIEKSKSELDGTLAGLEVSRKRADLLLVQLRVVRKRHGEIIELLSSGKLCSPRGIAVELNKLFPDGDSD